MRKAVWLLLLMLCACGSPADDDALRWAGFLDEHRARLEEGKFDAEQFRREGEPIVAELIRHRSPKDNRIPLTSASLKEWDRAAEDFRQAANKRETEGDPAAAKAFAALLDQLRPKSIES